MSGSCVIFYQQVLLMGKSCQSALILARQRELQKQSYFFGKHLSLACQAFMDLEPFRMSSLQVNSTFSLVSVQLFFHLDKAPTFYDDIKKDSNQLIINWY